MSQIKPGTRVVRGPDWNSKKQDNGEGFLGTVIFVPKPGSDDKKVTVIWDSGRELRYRAGDDGKYDLRVFDNAPAGIQHPSITCDSCSEEGIHGIRWKCCNCNDYDLCHVCYMNDKHDPKHSFVRVDTPDTTAVNVPPRASSKKCKRQAKGIFPNAEVMRGPHWKWKNDDGGEGGVGVVKKLDTWGKDSYRGAVKIAWKTDNLVKNYRVGGEGCVDVIYTRMTETANGGDYYADHLPLVDVVNPGQVFLKIGDKVVINLPLASFKQLQDNQVYGGWDNGMQQCLDEVGTIVGFLFNGISLKVQYEDSKTWVMNKVAVTRKHTFNQGDAVKILDNYNTVKELQKGHGGWNDEMKSALGKIGRILRLDADGDMRIKIGDKTWIFNPTCITPVEDDAAKKVPQLTKQETKDLTDDEGDSSSDESGGQAVAEAIAQIFVGMLKEQPDTEEDTVSIVEAAAKGDLKVVQKILKRHPERVDQKVEGKTALQLACYEGYFEIAELLLKNKADVNIKDSEGDAPLHYAAYGKESKIVKLLLDYKANVNAVNAKKQSALHISVNKDQPNCCRVLVEKGCDPNLQDDDNDTAMHDAIAEKDISDDIKKTVLSSTKCVFTTENTRGFNVLHWAVLKDSKLCVKLIVDKDKSCVNSQMKDGSTAMHIAAANDRVEIASLLLSEGKADINARDNMKRTPLILAVSLGKRKTMELLMTQSCDVNAQDNSGNTALHVAQVKKHLGPVHVSPGAKSEDGSQDTQIICLLIEGGASVDIQNGEGKTPLDFANDDMVRHFMRQLASKAKSNSLGVTQKGIPFPSNWEDIKKDTTVKQIVLTPTSGFHKIEYENIQKQFEKTLPQAQIISITRNQNMYLWEMYYLKKRNMERNYGLGCSNELSLFHGTTPDKLDVIAEQNLDPRLAGGRVGALFGRGTYFAVDAKYSDLYAQADQNGHKFMFLVKVLAGKTCIGKPEYSRPPPVDPQKSNSALYDSCVDNDKNPRIYCIFHDTQYYPEHLIEYM